MTTSSLAGELGIVPLPKDDPRVTTALFTFREAASYLDVPLSTLAEWTRHHQFGEGQPLIRAFDAEPGVASLPFVGLADTEPHSKQLVLREVLAGYLKCVQWDQNKWAERLHLPGFRTADVIVDVRRAYGRSVLIKGDARVEDLVGRWLGGDSLRDIAEDFGVPLDECEDAIRVGVQPLQPRAA